MKIKWFCAVIAASLLLPLSGGDASTTQTPLPGTKRLPAPSKTGGMPLMQAITERKTERDFKPGKIPDQMLADLLYAACGISHDGKLTIPTALNRQDIVLYVLLPDGAYRYLPLAKDGHGLALTEKKDLRRFATQRPGMGERGSLAVIIVGDKAKWKDMPDGAKYMRLHAGCAVQNIYLYCTSAGLATVVCGSFMNDELRKGLHLPETEEILIAQIIGGR